MVMRTVTGPVSAAQAEGEVKGKSGGQSPNSRELAVSIASESPNVRLSAYMKMIGNSVALAYLAATSDHSDIKEAARGELLKNPDALFRILDSMTGRYPQLWERELVRTLKDSLDPSSSRDAKILELKIWQLERSAAFSQSYGYKGDDGKAVEITDESPVQFNEQDLARILDATHA